MVGTLDERTDGVEERRGGFAVGHLRRDEGRVAGEGRGVGGLDLASPGGLATGPVPEAFGGFVEQPDEIALVDPVEGQAAGEPAVPIERALPLPARETAARDLARFRRSRREWAGDALFERQGPVPVGGDGEGCSK